MTESATDAPRWLLPALLAMAALLVVVTAPKVFSAFSKVAALAQQHAAESSVEASPAKSPR